jgi:hypothetical protein
MPLHPDLTQVARSYQGKLSRPLLDRIDLRRGRGSGTPRWMLPAWTNTPGPRPRRWTS